MKLLGFWGFLVRLGTEREERESEGIKGAKVGHMPSTYDWGFFFYFVVLGSKRKRAKEFGANFGQSCPMLHFRHIFIFLPHFFSELFNTYKTKPKKI